MMKMHLSFLGVDVKNDALIGIFVGLTQAMAFSRSFIYILLMISPTAILAGGFQVNLQGQKQIGMGHTGTALIMGPSSSFFNPGAFSFLETNSIALGACFIIPRTQYLEPSPGIYTTETEKGVGTPFTLYSSFRPGKVYGKKDSLGHRDKKVSNWNIGFAVYTPFGSGIKYPDDWKGQFVLREMKLTTIFLQTTIAYKINDKIGVGIAYIYALGSFKLRKGVPVQNQQSEYGEGELEAKGSGHGFNAGLYIKANDKLSFGLSYRSSVKFKAEDGSASFSVPSSLKEYFPNTSFNATINLPSVTNFGIAVIPKKNLTIAFDINYVGWSIYDSLNIDFEENTEKLEDINSARNYKNVFAFRLGAQYLVKENVTIRAGAYYDMTPVPDGYLTPETPGTNKVGITVGASFKLSEHYNLDLSFLYIEGAKRTDINLETGFGGTWKSRAYVPGFALQYIF